MRASQIFRLFTILTIGLLAASPSWGAEACPNRADIRVVDIEIDQSAALKWNHLPMTRADFDTNLTMAGRRVWFSVTGAEGVKRDTILTVETVIREHGHALLTRACDWR
jgi:hypothetical protein